MPSPTARVGRKRPYDAIRSLISLPTASCIAATPPSTSPTHLPGTPSFNSSTVHMMDASFCFPAADVMDWSAGEGEAEGEGREGEGEVGKEGQAASPMHLDRRTARRVTFQAEAVKVSPEDGCVDDVTSVSIEKAMEGLTSTLPVCLTSGGIFHMGEVDPPPSVSHSHQTDKPCGKKTRPLMPPAPPPTPAPTPTVRSDSRNNTPTASHATQGPQPSSSVPTTAPPSVTHTAERPPASAREKERPPARAPAASRFSQALRGLALPHGRSGTTVSTYDTQTATEDSGRKANTSRERAEGDGPAGQQRKGNSLFGRGQKGGAAHANGSAARGVLSPGGGGGGGHGEGTSRLAMALSFKWGKLHFAQTNKSKEPHKSAEVVKDTCQPPHQHQHHLEKDASIPPLSPPVGPSPSASPELPTSPPSPSVCAAEGGSTKNSKAANHVPSSPAFPGCTSSCCGCSPPQILGQLGGHPDPATESQTNSNQTQWMSPERQGGTIAAYVNHGGPAAAPDAADAVRNETGGDQEREGHGEGMVGDTDMRDEEGRGDGMCEDHHPPHTHQPPSLQLPIPSSQPVEGEETSGAVEADAEEGDVCDDHFEKEAWMANLQSILVTREQLMGLLRDVPLEVLQGQPPSMPSATPTSQPASTPHQGSSATAGPFPPSPDTIPSPLLDPPTDQDNDTEVARADPSHACWRAGDRTSQSAGQPATSDEGGKGAGGCGEVETAVRGAIGRLCRDYVCLLFHSLSVKVVVAKPETETIPLPAPTSTISSNSEDTAMRSPSSTNKASQSPAKGQGKVYALAVSQGSYWGPPYQLDGGWRGVIRGPGFEERFTTMSLRLRILAVPPSGSGVKLPLHGVSTQPVERCDLETAYRTWRLQGSPPRELAPQQLNRRRAAFTALQRFAKDLQEVQRQLPTLRFGDAETEAAFGGPGSLAYTEVGGLLKAMQKHLYTAFTHLRPHAATDQHAHPHTNPHSHQQQQTDADMAVSSKGGAEDMMTDVQTQADSHSSSSASLVQEGDGREGGM
ncbi:unnamed protein product [Vitrella brassicaformis CCMP3155]|uniref:Uncharacterized protein n=1 Tax=Vitrella brassicaformis (strain CCMP3155) TaxID=1169540 RepID=A0A0G4FJT6_VITBC|nr:unnamed protein product [Vitrella brassicaformis CCMP3155]|eukprot:CEM13965.1 unnamed protein product [Vitrella brassicaformis CCMP3155]